MRAQAEATAAEAELRKVEEQLETVRQSAAERTAVLQEEYDLDVLQTAGSQRGGGADKLLSPVLPRRSALVRQSSAQQLLAERRRKQHAQASVAVAKAELTRVEMDCVAMEAQLNVARAGKRAASVCLPSESESSVYSAWADRIDACGTSQPTLVTLAHRETPGERRSWPSSLGPVAGGASLLICWLICWLTC